MFVVSRFVYWRQMWYPPKSGRISATRSRAQRMVTLRLTVLSAPFTYDGRPAKARNAILGNVTCAAAGGAHSALQPTTSKDRIEAAAAARRPAACIRSRHEPGVA